jgi:uncharacterized membrane protein YsdA (DUF1294 family)
MLIERTSNPLAPAWYMAAIMALGLVAMIATRESAPRRVWRVSPETLNVELAGHAETQT